MRFKKSFVWILPLLCTAKTLASSYSKPEGYHIPEIRVRADSRDGLNMPPATYFSPETPLFLENQDFAFRLSVHLSEPREGLLKWSDKTGLGLHFLPPETYASGLSYFEDTDEILFEQVNYGYFSEGIMALSSSFSNLRRAFFDSKYLFMSSPQIIADQAQSVLVREKKNDSSQGLTLLHGNSQSSELLSTSKRNTDSPYSYLFPHTAQKNGRVALKVRHGRAGEISDSQPDEVILVDLADTTKARIRSLLRDHDSHSDSPFASFDNFGAIDSNGNLAWVATLKNGRRALVLKKFASEAPQILVAENESEILHFAHFPIDMNVEGVVFRATDKNHREGVWHVDFASHLTALLRRGDQVKTDHGPARVGVAGHTIFSSPRINSRGDVLAAAYLTTDTEEARDIGVGVFVITPARSSKDTKPAAGISPSADLQQ